MKVLNIYGSAGTGKTLTLTKMFLRAVEETGSPDRVAAVTYTKAAAQELRLRVAESLGLATDPLSLSRALPWVGTIHSLAYRLIGHPKLCTPERAYAFLSGQSAKEPMYRQPADLEIDRPLSQYDGDLDEYALALRLESSARHRMVVSYDALKTLPMEALARTTPDRLFELIRKYRAWKMESNTIDYEDMLSRGSEHAPPVKALFVDEAQDNSALLWSVLDVWMAGTQLAVFVGDPYQAIHQYSGADPQGFRSRPGRWVSLEKSYRLRPSDVDYAKRLLNRAGWNDPLIDTWQGAADGSPTEGGTGFALARTHKLVGELERMLIDQGLPFGSLAGKSPLEQSSARAWLASQEILRASGEFPAGHFSGLEHAVRKRLGDEGVAKLKHFVRDPDAPTTLAAFEEHMGDLLASIVLKIPWESYFRRVMQRHGPEALKNPKLKVGTIHSAKGLEADHVQVLRNWGNIPAKTLQDDVGAKEESCVAFVGVTRHRSTLTFIDGQTYGPQYPFA